MAEAAQTGTAIVPAGGARTGGSLERISALTAELRGRFLAMPPARRKWMMASALLVAAMCAGMMWYAGRTDWRVLFSGLDAIGHGSRSMESRAP